MLARALRNAPLLLQPQTLSRTMSSQPQPMSHPQTGPDNNRNRRQRKDHKAIIEYKSEFGEIADPALLKDDFFGIAPLIRVDEMFRSRVHMGHKVGTLNENMARFLHGERLGICILDLNKTAEYLFRALNFLAHIVYRDGVVLFVSAQKSHVHHVENLAKRVGEFAYTRDYEKGVFTDSTNRFTTKIRHPDVIIFTHSMNNVFERHWLIHEASMLQIPTIGIVDSNADPGPITYPIPGNDDTEQSLLYFLTLFEKTIAKAKEMNA